ncbi:MAG TPA: DapH/DapD/GlmU-related protein [Caulobacteraceae bacterium]|nr:DapH/DapD/GlmU-related protein [Caulobacteraceae bacterium]
MDDERRGGARLTRGPIARLQARVQRLIQTRFWGMDIHPSAQIATTALIDRTWPRGVHIGQDCIICEEAVVLTHDLTRGLYLHTRLGARTVMGPRSIVMPGVTVGEDCVLQPGAVVIRDMPAGSEARGNPAEITPRMPDET